MDISIFYSLCALFLPLLFALYLLVARVRLSFVSKNTLSNVPILINTISCSIFCYMLYPILKDGKNIEAYTNIFAFNKISFEIGYRIELENIIFLIVSSLMYLFLLFYSKSYFQKKKQFIFTKQRFYIFILLLMFNTYAFFMSPNLFQNFIFWIAQGFLIYFFSYFDIFKKPTNFNLTRFARISLLGDFSFLLAILILFKYAVLSQGYIKSPCLDFSELNILISYANVISEPFEFIICIYAFLTAIMSRMFIFPLSCYNSFFANSSNIFYLSTFILANCFFGAFLYLKILPFSDLFSDNILGFKIFILISILLSLFFILFEKSYKIIFGYLLSIVNGAFIILCLDTNIKAITIYSYFVICVILLLLLMFLFFNDKVSFNKRIINKQSGFLLERSHIFFFEVLPEKFFAVINFIDEKIIQNISYFIVAIINCLGFVFEAETKKIAPSKIIRNIFIIFCIVAILTILIALFGRFR